MTSNGQKLIGIALLAACSLIGTARADVYFCQQANGGTEVRDTPCRTSSGQKELARAGNYAAASSGMDYGRSHSPEVYDSMSGMAAWIASTKAQSRAARAQRASSTQKLAGYRDRIRDRELRMRADEIRDDIKRVGGSGLGNLGKAWALGDQLRSVEEERAYNWNNPRGY